MSDKRKDSKGRILRNGEVQLKDGRYRYKWRDASGNERVTYSWQLDSHDMIPMGKKKSLSLREQEKQIQKDVMDGIISYGGDMTVLDLVNKYVGIKTGVRTLTKLNYEKIARIIEKEPLGSRRIDTVKMSDVKELFIKLQRDDGKKYSTVKEVRGVLRPAFRMAVNDDLIRKNPADFPLAEILYRDDESREAISPEDEEKFLEFVKNDPQYKANYGCVYILFKTGLRISEFCGLTIKDINFKNHSLIVERQLQKTTKGATYYIEKPKSKSGTRILPMTPDVEECFRMILEERKAPKVEESIDGYVGFLYYTKNNKPFHAREWDKRFQRMVKKYNRTHMVQMPLVTPHVCRHTFCTNMARKGISPKTLQYLMGHANVAVTLNIYTHSRFDDIRAEVFRTENSGFAAM